jgi:hypothetical protein
MLMCSFIVSALLLTDFVASLFWQKDWNDVTTNCLQPCTSGQDTECPNQLTCFAFTTCRPSPKPIPQPASVKSLSPSESLQQTNAPGMSENNETIIVEKEEETTTPAATNQTSAPSQTTQTSSGPPTSVTTTSQPSYLVATSTPTDTTVVSPTTSPTNVTIVESSFPTSSPSFSQPSSEITSKPPTTSVSIPAPAPGLIAKVGSVLTAAKPGVTNEILLSFDAATGTESPTKLYQYDGFVNALGIFSKGKMGSNHFYLGDDAVGGENFGLVNIALFLAHASVESVKFDVCDEISWEKDVFGMYPLSNACGQGRFTGSTSEYASSNQCTAEEASMACQVDANMKAIAETQATWPGAPPPLECYPTTSPARVTGAWNPLLDSIDPNNVPSPNSFGSTDVAGCCWWGRGPFPRYGSAGTWYVGVVLLICHDISHDFVAYKVLRHFIASVTLESLIITSGHVQPKRDDHQDTKVWISVLTPQPYVEGIRTTT